MAHFAKIENIENNLFKVISVIVVPDDQEHRGAEFINTDLNIDGTWIQCSFNTKAGRHLAGKTPFRKNYPLPGWLYDSSKDAFIPPKPQKNSSFILDEDMCIWIPPVPYPLDRYYYTWNEQKLQWEKSPKAIAFPESWVWDRYEFRWNPPVPYPLDGKKYYWNESIVNWSLVESNV